MLGATFWGTISPWGILDLLDDAWGGCFNSALANLAGDMDAVRRRRLVAGDMDAISCRRSV